MRLKIVAVYVVLSMLSCTSAQDINHVQSNYVSKKIFTGQWYYGATVVDKQYNNASHFVGSACDGENVRFEITQKFLNVYRAYEKAAGTESAHAGGQTLVAAFPILKHFDVIRDYNPSNGVANNLLIESERRRAWQEREFMRVDWANNMVPDLLCNDWIRADASAVVSRNMDNNPRDIWRVRVSDDYVETTSEMLVNKEQSTCAIVGDWNCAGSAVKMKFSFRKLPEKNDYEPRDYADSKVITYGNRTVNGKEELCVGSEEGCKKLKILNVAYTSQGSELCDPLRHSIDSCSPVTVPVFERFGFFRTERFFSEREHGLTLAGRKQFINRWNIWQQSRLNDGTLIPLKYRIPKPIVYHLNVSFPPYLREAAQTVANEWNYALSDGIAKAKNDCSRSHYFQYVEKNNLQDAMRAAGFGVVTEASVKDACKALGLVSEQLKVRPLFFDGSEEQAQRLYGRMFEIRVNDCNEEHVQAYAREHDLLGELDTYGLANIDENNLEEACAVLEWASEKKGIEPRFHWQQIGDMRYSIINFSDKAELSGPLGYGPSQADKLTGEIYSATANIYGAALQNYAAMAADMVQMISSASPSTSPFPSSPPSHTHFARMVDERMGAQDMLKSIEVSPVSFGKTLNVISKSSFETEYLMNDEMRNILPSNWMQSEYVGDDVLHAYGLSRAVVPVNKDSIAAWEQKLEFMDKHNACFAAEIVEPAIAELAKELKGQPWKTVYDAVLKQIFVAVLLHEVGHTLGLRHNFQSSTDAMNFKPQFWGAHDSNGYDRTLSARNSEYRYSSIMDYTQRFNSDFAGIGYYDVAAIRMGYFNQIEIFDEQAKSFVSEPLYDLAYLFTYKDLPYLFSGPETTTKIIKHITAVREQNKHGDENARIDISSLNIKAVVDNLYKRRFVDFDEYYHSYSLSQAQSYMARPTRKVDVMYAVPYKYCSDSYATGGNIWCNRFDMGASAEEIVDNAAQMYNSYYLFNSFNRDRVHFDVGSYIAKTYNRTFRPMTTPYKTMYRMRSHSAKIWPMVQDMTVAAHKGLNFLGRVLQAVEPGDYCLEGDSYVPAVGKSTCNNIITIGLDQGRYYHSNFTNEQMSKTLNIGFMYDKILALQALTDDSIMVSRDLSSQATRGAFSISYYRMFAPEMIKLFSSYTLNNRKDHAARVVVHEDGKAEIVYQPLVGAGDNRGFVIEPNESYILRHYATALPMLRFSSTVDKQFDYAKLARVSVLGSRHDPAHGNSVDEMTFIDPKAMIAYKAMPIANGVVAPGYELLKSARDLVEGRWVVANQNWRQAENNFNAAAIASIDPLDLQRLNEERERAWNNKVIVDKELDDRLHMITLVRKLGDLMEYGN